MTDNELLIRWADAGDEAAFAELVARHAPWARAVAERRLGTGTGAAAEAVQRAFTMLARKARALRQHPCLRAWIHKAVVVETAHTARREAHHRRKMADFAEHIRSATASHHAMDDARHLLTELDGVLARLAAGDREILLLRHVEGRSFREIGALLGKNEAAAQKQGARALARLTSALRKRHVIASGAAVIASLASTGTTTAAADASATTALAARAIAEAPHVSLLTLLNHTLLLMSHGKRTQLTIAGIILLVSGFAGSYGLARHRVEGDAAKLAARPAAGLPDARRPSSGPGSPLGHPDREALRHRLEAVAQFFVVDAARRTADLKSAPFHPTATVDREGMKAFASLRPEDVPMALAIAQEWRTEAAKFDSAIAMLGCLLLEAEPAATVAEQLCSPDFCRDGKASAVALGSALTRWAEDEPAAAWRFLRTHTVAGTLPFDKTRPFLPRVLGAWLVHEPERAIDEMRQLPPEWSTYAIAACRAALSDTAGGRRFTDALATADGDDSLALTVASSHPSDAASVEALLPWLTTRAWHGEGGARRALHRWTWNGDRLDEPAFRALAAQSVRQAPASGGTLVRQWVRETLAEVTAGSSPEQARRVVTHLLPDAGVRREFQFDY